MARRNIKEYVGLTRNVITNKLYTSLSQQGNVISFKHKFKGLLEESIFKWFFNDAKTPMPHPYKVDKSQTSIYDITSPAKIALAADWASDTVQSEKIGVLMGQHEPDYTIHLGDTYYSGSADETHANFDNGRWPMGKIASFALLGNHEMYSGAFPYFDYLLPQILKQPNPFFCLRNDHWCILGLDTGYQSIFGGPHNTDLHFQDELMTWLSDTVKLWQDKRGIVVLTHHQYFSAFRGEDNFQNPAWQLQSFFNDDREIIWIWGHEHRFSMYGKYKKPDVGELKYVTAYGRCIGNGGMPDEHKSNRTMIAQSAEDYNLVLWDHRDVDEIPAYIFWKVKIGANGYSVMELDGDQLVISYFSSYTNDDLATPVEQLIVRETWKADNQTGAITCIKTEDCTVDPLTGLSKLSYRPGADISGIGK